MKIGRHSLLLALLLLGLICVNYLASALPFRFDTTEESLYTLSPGTHSLLAKINEPVQVTFYFSRSNETLPTTYKNYATRIQEMLRQYVRASGGLVQLTVVDPKPDTPEEEKATAAGLSPQLLPTGEKIYFGLVATQADQQKAIAAFTPQREPFLEYDLSQLLFSVQQVTRPRLGLLTSLPLQGTPAMPMARRPAQPGQFVASEWAQSFEIVPVEASASELPANLDVLAVLHPQGLSPQLEYAIDQFILSGKPTLLAVDPASQFFKRQQNPMMMGGPQPGASSDLPALFRGYGVEYSSQDLVGDLRLATQVQTGAGGIVRYPIWLSLDKGAFQASTLATAQLNTMLLVESGALTVKPGPDIVVTPLLQTSDDAGMLPAMTAGFAPPESLANQVKPEGRKALAVLIQGKLKSAFPAGAPAPSPATDAPTPPPAPAGLQESTTRSSVVIIADTDWLLDDYSVRRMNFLGTSAAEPLNDNLAFGSNILELLAGSQDLLTLRGKGSSQRPFLVVKEMEFAANQRYQVKLQELEDRLAKVQSQLSELQTQKAPGNKLVATPEVQKAIEDFRKQEASMRAERREIRKALREDIEALGNRLLLLNLFFAPFALTLFAFWFQRQRRAA